MSTAAYAAAACTAEGPFFSGISAASDGLQNTSSSTDPTTVRNALSTFADNAKSATATFRSSIAKIGIAKSSAVQRSAAQLVTRLKGIEKLLTTTNKDIASLNVNDVNGFGLGLAIVQKDLVKVSNGYTAIGKLKNPKELEHAVKNDPVCQKILVDAAARGSGG